MSAKFTANASVINFAFYSAVVKISTVEFNLIGQEICLDCFGRNEMLFFIQLH